MSETALSMPRLSRAFRYMPLHVNGAIRALRMFAQPWRLLKAYFFGRSMNHEVLRMRDGTTMETSSSASDPATLFVVFVREEYAPIPRGAVIVDVGANIGAFSVYAARSGAKRVIAYEPSREAFETLKRNVERNALGRAVVTEQRAVVGRDGVPPVPFPVASSPMNRIMPGEFAVSPSSNVEVVPTVSLDEIVREHGNVDLLKLDCEGAEYDIVEATSAHTWSRIRAISLEYHEGRADWIISSLRAHGFNLRAHMPNPEWSALGMLHLHRA